MGLNRNTLKNYWEIEMSERNKCIHISDLVEEYGSIGKVLKKVQDYKLEANLKNYQLFINGEEEDNDDFMIRSDSLFVKEYDCIDLHDTLVVDIHSLRNLDSRPPYEDVEIKVNDIYITFNSLESNRRDPSRFSQRHISTVTISFPLIRKEDNYSRFRVVELEKEKYQLSKKQAKVLWYLWKMNQHGISDVESFDILSFVKSDVLTTKVRDLFRSDDGPAVLKSLIEKSAKRGRWTLSKAFLKSIE